MFFFSEHVMLKFYWSIGRKDDPIYISIMQTKFPRIKSADSRQTKIL